jgi:hypothetical protein
MQAVQTCQGPRAEQLDGGSPACSGRRSTQHAARKRALGHRRGTELTQAPRQQSAARTTRPPWTPPPRGRPARGTGGWRCGSPPPQPQGSLRAAREWRGRVEAGRRGARWRTGRGTPGRNFFWRRAEPRHQGPTLAQRPSGPTQPPPVMQRAAASLSSSTRSSAPPTSSSAGAATAASRSPARSGRPPRDTTAATRGPRLAAAHSAAPPPARAARNAGGEGDEGVRCSVGVSAPLCVQRPATGAARVCAPQGVKLSPVDAPKKPTGKPGATWPSASSHASAASRRDARRAASKTLRRSAASASVSRSNRSVATPDWRVERWLSWRRGGLGCRVGCGTAPSAFQAAGSFLSGGRLRSRRCRSRC